MTPHHHRASCRVDDANEQMSIEVSAADHERLAVVDRGQDKPARQVRRDSANQTPLKMDAAPYRRIFTADRVGPARGIALLNKCEENSGRPLSLC